MKQCPKCHYARTATDSHVPAGVCPACGIAYNKYIAAQQAASVDRHGHGETDDSKIKLAYIEPAGVRLRSLLFAVPAQVPATVFYGRLLCFAVFLVWGGWFIATNGSWTDINHSFMHAINLAFHEAGHVVFRPFGRFMTILGGSLFQVLVPLIVMVAFLKQGDRFAASVMLWWCGQNFIDLSPYISDAEYRGLPLIAGMGEESHDWGNLLTMLDMVEQAYALGRASFVLGCVVIVLSLVWGGHVLWRQRQHITNG